MANEEDAASGHYADVFIAYAREDLEFVRRLHATLEQHERYTWLVVAGPEPTPTAD